MTWMKWFWCPELKSDMIEFVYLYICEFVFNVK
jgi:hypothetical protein